MIPEYIGWRTQAYNPFCIKTEPSFGVGNGDKFLFNCKRAKARKINPIIARTKPIILNHGKNSKDQATGIEYKINNPGYHFDSQWHASDNVNWTFGREMQPNSTRIHLGILSGMTLSGTNLKSFILAILLSIDWLFEFNP